MHPAITAQFCLIRFLSLLYFHLTVISFCIRILQKCNKLFSVPERTPLWISDFYLPFLHFLLCSYCSDFHPHKTPSLYFKRSNSLFPNHSFSCLSINLNEYVIIIVCELSWTKTMNFKG